MFKEMMAAACAKSLHISRSLNSASNYYSYATDASVPNVSPGVNHKFPSLSENCAEYPHASILKEVPTDPSSPPIESVLLSQSHAPLTLFWQGPSKLTRFVENLYSLIINKPYYSIDIVITLPFVTLVRELALLVDARGYSPLDAPTLSVCVGHTLESVETFLASGKNSSNPLPDVPARESTPEESGDFDKAYSVGEWTVDQEGDPFSM